MVAAHFDLKGVMGNEKSTEVNETRMHRGAPPSLRGYSRETFKEIGPGSKE